MVPEFQAFKTENTVPMVPMIPEVPAAGSDRSNVQRFKGSTTGSEPFQWFHRFQWLPIKPFNPPDPVRGPFKTLLD